MWTLDGLRMCFSRELLPAAQWMGDEMISDSEIEDLINVPIQE